MRALREAVRDLRRHKLRSLLSGISMLVGVVALVAASAAGAIASDMLVAHEEQKNSRAITYGASFNVPMDATMHMSESVYERLIAASGATTGVVVSTTTDVFVGDPLGESRTVFPIEWTLGDLNEVRRLPVVDGVLPVGTQQYPPVLSLNEAAAQRLQAGPGSVLFLATTMTNQPTQFSVSAVVADGSQEPQGYAPMMTLGSLVTAASGAASVQLRVTNEQVSEVQAARLISDAVADAGLADSVEVRRVDTTWQVLDQVRLLEAIFTAASLVLLGIAAIALINVGLASIGDRARELTVRRALGATRAEVFLLVTGATVAASVPVALLGTGIALIGVQLIIPAWLPAGAAIAAPAFPWYSLVIGISAALVTAFLGALAPAVRATRLDIALALRE